MSFKSDRSFLAKVTVGAIGTAKVREVLQRDGHEIIELERFSTSNKIWATKVKRVRVPDLLCLRCGTRFESRAKALGSLAIRMSHTPGSEERSWDSGLRSSDQVAFVACSVDAETGVATVADAVNFFQVAEMRSTEALAIAGTRKAAAEGAELDLRWKGYVPGFDGIVASVDDKNIVFTKSNSHTQRYSLRGLIPHVEVGDRIVGRTTIAASILAATAPVGCPGYGADFSSALTSENLTDVYVAVKAIGHLRASSQETLKLLKGIATGHKNELIRLEADGALSRQGDTAHLTSLVRCALNRDIKAATRMESVLILGEVGTADAADALVRVAHGTTGELQACAIWGIGAFEHGNLAKLLPFLRSPEQVVVAHAIASVQQVLSVDNAHLLVRLLDSNDATEAESSSAAFVLRQEGVTWLPEFLVEQLAATVDRGVRQRLIYVLAHHRLESVISRLDNIELDDGERELLDVLTSQIKGDWTKKVDKADYLDFVIRQSVDRYPVSTLLPTTGGVKTVDSGDDSLRPDSA